MNYGKEYVKKYNRNLKMIVSNAISIFEKHYETNYSFSKVENIITHHYRNELNILYEKIDTSDDLFQKVNDYFDSYRKNYSNNKTISVINDEIKNEIFEKRKDKSKIKDYSEFIDLLYIRESIRDYFHFINQNLKLLEIKFKKRKITDVIILVERKGEINNFKGFSNETIVKKSKMSELIQLDKKQKIILLNILINHLRGNNKLDIAIPETEIFRVFILCSDAFQENDFFRINTNYTDYEYFRKGMMIFEKNLIKRRDYLQSIIDEIQNVENLENILKLVKRYRARLKNN